MTPADDGACLVARHSPNGEMISYIRADHVSALSSRDLVVTKRSSGERQTVAKKSGSSWCWSLDSSRIFFVDSLHRQIFQYDLQTGKTRSLRDLAGSSDPDVGFFNLAVSPNGSRLGFIADDSFQAIDLETGIVERIFSCEELQTAEWGPSGICYIGGTAVGLLLHTDGESRELAVGNFRGPHWLDPDHVIVVELPNKIWIYDVRSGYRKLVYPNDG